MDRNSIYEMPMAFRSGISIRSAAKWYGFNLVEVMIVMTIIGIIVTVAAPNFGYFIKNSRLRQASETLNSSLVEARSEALRTQSEVRLCRTGNIHAVPANLVCEANVFGTGSANDAKDWSHGWLVYAKTGAAVPYDSTNPETLLIEVAKSGLADDNVVITSSNTADVYVTFGADGRLDTNTPVLAVCDDRNGGADNKHGYRISFSASGRTIVDNFLDLAEANNLDPAILVGDCTP